MKWKFAIGIVVIILVCVGFTFLIPKEEELPLAPVIINDDADAYETVKVMRGDVLDIRTTYCEYTATVTENLYFKVDGYAIDEVFVESGDTVKEGQLLATLNLEDLKEQLSTYQNDLSKFELELKQIIEQKNNAYENQEAYRKTLSQDELSYTPTASEFVSNYLSVQQEIEDKITIQKLRIEEVEGKISERQIISPIDGIITSAKSVSENQLSDRSMRMFEVIDNASLLFSFTSLYYGDILEVGEEVEMSISKVPYTAVVTEVTYNEDEDKYYYYLKINELTASISDGEKGKMELVFFQSLDVLYLPSESICQSKGKDAVYYINEDGIRDVKYVELGLDAGGYVEIKSGVEEGETILMGWD